MKIITIANQKGGVGKTTLSSHLGFAAAAANMRVLLADFDPQGSLGLGFGASGTSTRYLRASDLFLADGILEKPLRVHDEQISVLPAGSYLDLVFTTLPPELLKLLREEEGDVDEDDEEDHQVNEAVDSKILALLLEFSAPLIERVGAAFAQHASEFDLCIIDTPPGRGPLLITALALSDCVITPMSLGLYEQGGTTKLFKTIEGTRDAFNDRLRHLGIQLMKMNPRSPKDRVTIDRMRQVFGDYLLPDQLTELKAVRQAVDSGVPVWENPRGSSHEKAAKEWQTVTSYLLNEVTK